ncbi:carbamoyl-phosphate synthase large subunit [Sinanaerobacter chloroacetimidivorans]|uniref:Carbamoyl phosphate synthase large chain n=1 Tax=Sinanaerobacter chloroacetimidivorans TaxID=2818044 RepID=A0A8J8B2U8_9FIRM|nr:carbamoyl-phosphate synthase large subunit [Sinanaerobacter chloroacetimidivorans]MBR0599694.1 carbamoyl-phosphate synthase large subunit [Sinanaerobacter chloroacetimidivorans]
MPLRKDIKKVLVIGSGPIIIGQAAEFDYAGTQVCRTLKDDGLEVVLVNSNPATIMTDKTMADKVYIEPLTLPVLKKIIKLEKPDSILPTMGGQTALTLSMQLAKEGFLQEQNVKLLGATPETIDKAEDRQLFKDMLESIGEPVIPSKVVNNLEDALQFAEEIGYPVIVRPAYTLGGTGGGIASNVKHLKRIAENGLRLSPITQILVERCVSGWKEIEFEIIRDSKNNTITVCSMENVDPVGVHTGDSIVVAPAVTLSDKEYQMLRTASINIIQALGVEGGCNCQFALNPDNFEYAVIEVNPRVSRSSALASKATGYPIAKVASKIAIGYTLDEILNSVTGKTYACFEPALDYIVVKFPKWPFDKFVYAKRTLGTQMKATGEVMAIGTSFEQAMMKAVRSIELGLDSLNLKKLKEKDTEEIEGLLHNCDDERIFVVYEALKRGIPVDTIFDITKIDRWFLCKLNNLVLMEAVLQDGELTQEKYKKAKDLGFLDSTVKKLSGQEPPQKLYASYKMVDTCAAEFAAVTPYFYSTFDEENEAKEFMERKKSGKKKVIVFGSGPIRIGQGIEFDYCSVHCVSALKEAGYEAIIVNNNPETVSTDFDISDRLYFEPLTPEDVDSIIHTEDPWGVVVQFGGQTAIKLTKYLKNKGVKILGTSADSIDAAEDRERFDKLLENCNIPRPNGRMAYTTEEAVKEAAKLGFPVLLRPSYVLGGQNMIIAHTQDDVVEYMDIITSVELENPVLIDKYLMGTEVEVDAVCDGEDFLIPGIMEHIERAGVHSGDSISVYPPQTLSQEVRDVIIEYTGRLARELKVKGLVNIQYVLYEDQVYVIEVNPRSSRTVPYISKVTNVPIVDLATKVLLGAKLTDLGYGSGVCKESEYVAVKVPVFSFPKLHDADNHLGPEMKSTGEVLGIDKDFETALFKGLIAAGYELHKVGDCVLVTVKDADKPELVPLAQKFIDFGYKICATKATGEYLMNHGIPAEIVNKNDEPSPNTTDLFDSGEVDFVVSTSKIGRKPAVQSVQMRRKAIERNIACLTSIDTANALANCLIMKKTIEDFNMIDIVKI